MNNRVCRLYGQGDLRIETDPVAELGPDDVLLKIGAGGICGSDLHYYNHGGIGDIRVIDPIILGHEIAGTVEAVGTATSGLVIGDTVALNPSTACNECSYCRAGLQQHCLDMFFLGSAMRRPHVQGGFRDFMVVKATQCVTTRKGTSLAAAALAEPLAVCLHAATRVSSLVGQRVLVTGAGPIGCLSVCVAKHLGASEIVVTDIESHTLSIASRVGASRTINVATQSDLPGEFSANKGYFDVCFECSGAAPAIEQAIGLLKPQGTLVQIGNAGMLPAPFNRIVSKEISIIGSFRFHAEFAQAVRLIDDGSIDVLPLVTDAIPLHEAASAFTLANDRGRAVKVLLLF